MVRGERVLGHRIRAARTARGLSLAGLGRLTGVSKSLLSQVERGVAQPSLASLRKIARALEVPISRLLTEDSTTGSVVRRAQRKEISWPSLGVAYEFVSPDDRKSIQMVLIQLEPGGRSCEEPTGGQRLGEECSLVLVGVVDAVVGDDQYRLEEGDSITFDRAAPHQYLNVGSVPATLVTAVYPATF